jgi:hypothetical protein
MAAIPPMTAMLERNFMVDVKWVWFIKTKKDLKEVEVGE